MSELVLKPFRGIRAPLKIGGSFYCALSACHFRFESPLWAASHDAAVFSRYIEHLFKKGSQDPKRVCIAYYEDRE
jgi:hypothetical protein